MTDYKLYEFQVDDEMTFRAFDCIWEEEDREARNKIRFFRAVRDNERVVGKEFSKYPYVLHSKDLNHCEFCYDRIMGSCTEEHNLCKETPLFTLDSLLRKSFVQTDELHFNVSPYAPIWLPLNKPMVTVSAQKHKYVYFLTDTPIGVDNFQATKDLIMANIYNEFCKRAHGPFNELASTFITLDAAGVEESLNFFKKLKPTILLFMNDDFS